MLLFSLLSHFRNSSEISKAWNNHKQSYVIIYHEISVELLKIKNKDVNVVPQHEAAHVSISKKKKKKGKRERCIHSVELLPLYNWMRQRNSERWMPTTIHHIKWNGMRSTLIG